MEGETQRKPSILLLGSFPPQAQGIPGYCGALAEALAARGAVRAVGFKAMYPAVLFPGVKSAMDPTCRKPEAPSLIVDHALAWYNPLGWLWRAFRTHADLIHIQWWSLPLFPVCLTFALAARLRRKPIVITVHNVLPHESSPWFVRAGRVLYGLADHCIVHSEVNRAQLREYFHVADARVDCIPMGVDKVSWSSSGAEKAKPDSDNPPDCPTLLFFGTIRPYKGLDVLLRALAKVRTRHPEFQLLVIGKPWESWVRYQAIIDQEGIADHIIKRLDYIPEAEVPLYVASADLVVLPYTHFDAQSAVGAQVIGHGRPMIVTDCGGLPALVNHDPRWIAAPGDPATLADRICTFLDDPAAAAADFAAGALHAAKDRTWTASANAHWAIYERLLDWKTKDSVDQKD